MWCRLWEKKLRFYPVGRVILNDSGNIGLFSEGRFFLFATPTLIPCHQCGRDSSFFCQAQGRWQRSATIAFIGSLITKTLLNAVTTKPPPQNLNFS